jgi:hypothetical protein
MMLASDGQAQRIESSRLRVRLSTLKLQHELTHKNSIFFAVFVDNLSLVVVLNV